MLWERVQVRGKMSPPPQLTESLHCSRRLVFTAALRGWAGGQGLSEPVKAGLAHAVPGPPGAASRPDVPGCWGADR